MNSNRFEGAARNIGDKVQDAANSFMRDAPGRLNEAADRAQEAYGQAAGQVKSFTNEKPVGALLTAMGLGLFVGYVLARR